VRPEAVYRTRYCQHPRAGVEYPVPIEPNLIVEGRSGEPSLLSSVRGPRQPYMRNPAVYRALGGLVEGVSSTTADSLIDQLLDQGFKLQDIADTIDWVYEDEVPLYQRRVFSVEERYHFSPEVQNTLLTLADSGWFTPEEVEWTIWKLLQESDGSIDDIQVMEAFGNAASDPYTTALLTPGLLRH